MEELTPEIIENEKLLNKLIRKKIQLREERYELLLERNFENLLSIKDELTKINEEIAEISKQEEELNAKISRDLS